MSGRPGDGCTDPRALHDHWCGTCGAKVAFSREQCEMLTIVPPCQRCGDQDWRDEVDELAAPDYREDRP